MVSLKLFAGGIESNAMVKGRSKISMEKIENQRDIYFSIRRKFLQSYETMKSYRVKSFPRKIFLAFLLFGIFHSYLIFSIDLRLI